MAKKEEKSRYSDEELKEFETIINEKLAKAREQEQSYLRQLKELAENPDNKIKGLDDGSGSMESERIFTLIARVRKHIQHLEHANIRIHNKVYGICRVTGKLISKERLKAVPHATLSIDAKQRQK